MARTQIFGHVTLELDGQFNATIDDPRAFFDHVALMSARQIGFAG
jgi:chorismate mutase